MQRKPWIALAIAASCSVAQCHDWDRFNRQYSGAGTVNGDFRCRAPYALVGVWGANQRPFVAREPLSEGASECRDLPLSGFTERDAIRAIAVDGSRVLVAGDGGACILELADDSLRETCVAYPATSSIAVRDAFVRVENGVRRFAITLNNGSSSRSITTVFLEDDAHEFSRSVSLSQLGLSAVTSSSELMSLASAVDPATRVFAARVASEQLVSATQENTDRQPLIAIDGSPPIYVGLGVGPDNENGPHVALLREEDATRFDVFANRTRRTGLSCSECVSIEHVIPVTSGPLEHVVACSVDQTGAPRLMLRREGGACVQGRAWPAQRSLSRMAIRWQ